MKSTKPTDAAVPTAPPAAPPAPLEESTLRVVAAAAMADLRSVRKVAEGVHVRGNVRLRILREFAVRGIRVPT